MATNRDIEEKVLQAARNILDSDLSNIQQVILNRCEALDIPRSKVPAILGMSRSSFDRYFNGESKSVDVEFVGKLARFLNEDPVPLATQLMSLLAPDSRENINRTAERVFLLEHFDLQGLKYIGVLKQTRDLDEAINRVCHYLGLSSLFDYEYLIPQAFHSASNRSHSTKMRTFWATSARMRFEQFQSPHKYDRQKLLSLMKRIPRYTMYEGTGFTNVLKALYRIGVTVHVHQFVSKTSVRGATMIVNNQPCIVVTNFGDRYDSVWFTLLHELVHVLYHWDQLLDQETHLSTGDMLDLYLTERQADAVAIELLISEKRRRFISSHLDDPLYVYQYSQRLGTHMSVIYGICAYEIDDEKTYRMINALKFNNRPVRLPSSIALHDILSDPWSAETVLDGIEISQTLYEEV